MPFINSPISKYYIVPAAKLMVALALLTASRLLLYIVNIEMFPGISVLHLLWITVAGLRFDFAAILMINSLFILLNILPFPFTRNIFYQKTSNIIFIFTNAIALLPNFADLIYYRFTLKRTTGDIFDYLFVNNDLGTQFPQFIKDFWYIFVMYILAIGTLIWITGRFNLGSAKNKNTEGFSYKLAWPGFILVSALTLVGIRGGLQLKPISLITAGKYTQAANVPLVLNSPFTIIKTINQQALPKMKYFANDADAEAIYPVFHQFSSFSDSLHAGSEERPNVVLIILESFSQEHIGALNRNAGSPGYAGFTPFLDSLIGESMVFNGIANGKRSIEGIPAILSGLPALMNQDFITSVYAGNQFNSLASLLKPEGYSTSFYHGGSNGTMGFDAYTRSAGFEHYYGRAEYANEADYDGQWGIWDEPFLQYFAKNLNKTKEPFLSAVFTLSSHHPYQVPVAYTGKFRKGNLEIQQSILYADYSLRRFFAAASKMPWFDKTLFVITADHTSEAWLPRYRTRTGRYEIPVLFYRHNSQLKGKRDFTTQQTDIMPSVLDYLRYNKPFVAFGQSVFAANAPHLGVSFLNNSWQLSMDGFTLEWDGNKTTGFFHYLSDTLLKSNISSGHSPKQVIMEKYVKSIIQQYNSRMSANQLTVKP
jgi:phosphoglycerol transferase MdoB-like AlkP superfamily enzyme